VRSDLYHRWGIRPFSKVTLIEQLLSMSETGRKDSGRDPGRSADCPGSALSVVAGMFAVVPGKASGKECERVRRERV